LEISLKKVTVIHDRHAVLDNFSARFPTQAVTSLIGDEKSGKVTVLRVIAGIEKIDAGDVLIDGRSILETPAGERDVALVHGADSLIPHKSVAENIAFPLRLAGLSKPDMASRVSRAAEQFGLLEHAKTKAKKLSPTDRLRVSYARAFVRQPRSYLINQTVSSEAERGVARDCLPILLTEGASVIIATNEPDEALKRGDRLCLIKQGRIVQRGSCAAVVASPRNLWVAKQLGLRLLEGTVLSATADTVRVRTPDGREADIQTPAGADIIGERVTLALVGKQGGTDLAHALLFDDLGTALNRPEL